MEGDRDAYEIDGDVTFLESDGLVRVLVDGSAVDPREIGRNLSNHLVVVGEESDTASTYEFTVDGYVARNELASDAPVDDMLVSINDDDDDLIEGTTAREQERERPKDGKRAGRAESPARSVDVARPRTNGSRNPSTNQP